MEPCRVRDSLGVESRGPRRGGHFSFADCGQFVYYPARYTRRPCRAEVESWSTQQYRIQVGTGDNDERTPSAGWLAGSVISIICFTKRRRFIGARSSPTPG
jgi:hypothetical protein